MQPLQQRSKSNFTTNLGFPLVPLSARADSAAAVYLTKVKLERKQALAEMLVARADSVLSAKHKQ